MFEESKEATFMKKHFQKYYLTHKVDSVPDVERREFGYGVFKRKIANRNLAFSGVDGMNRFLREKTPLFFSYSNSYYSFPDKQPMQNKGWLQSDLIYEFDADEINAVCEKTSGAWICNKTFGEENAVKEIDNKQWFLDKSLELSKQQLFRLVDFLKEDFGFDLDKIAINFSGKAGYHLHIRKKEIQKLNKKARIELVDYITGYGMFYDNIGFETEKALRCPKGSGLWGKRINKGIKEFFNKDAKEISRITKLPSAKLNVLMKNKSEVINGIEKGLLYDVGARTNKEFWKSVIDFVVQTYMVPIDRQTSIDLHKIIRVPNTLHGETGFIAKEITLEKLKDFNPFNDAIVFGDEMIRVFIKNAPKFNLKGNSFGPYENELVEVPLYCAIFLVGKGVAELR